MSNLQWFDFLRIGTIVFALIALYMSAKRAHRDWDDFTNRLRELWWAMNALLLLLIEGNAEQIIQNSNWGPRTLLGFMVALACVRAQFRKEGYTKAD